MFKALVENGAIIRYPYMGSAFFPVPPRASVTDVSPTPMPPPLEGRKAVEIEPRNINGEWFQNWDYIDISPAEALVQDETQARLVRERRNALLVETDWTQFTDSPLSAPQKEAWATYRQALRDVPEQASFPWDIVWPTQP